jgi:hypothetical protein
MKYRLSRNIKRTGKEQRRLALVCGMLILAASAAHAGKKEAAKNSDDLPVAQADPVVDIELLTWPEIYKAIH